MVYFVHGCLRSFFMLTGEVWAVMVVLTIAMNAIVPVGMEMAADAAYPISEGSSTSVVVWMFNLLSFVFLLGLNVSPSEKKVCLTTVRWITAPPACVTLLHKRAIIFHKWTSHAHVKFFSYMCLLHGLCIIFIDSCNIVTFLDFNTRALIFIRTLASYLTLWEASTVTRHPGKLSCPLKVMEKGLKILGPGICSWFSVLCCAVHTGMTVLRSESPSGTCAKLRTVAASNNRDHPTRSLSSSPLASTVNCSPGSQALLEVTHQDHSIEITVLLLVRATCMYGVVLHAHPVRDESHNQRNITGEVATTSHPFYNEPHRSHVLCVKA